MKKDLFGAGKQYGNLKVLEKLRHNMRTVAVTGSDGATHTRAMSTDSLRILIAAEARDLISDERVLPSSESDEKFGLDIFGEFGLRPISEGIILVRFGMPFSRESVTHVRHAMKRIGWVRNDSRGTWYPPSKAEAAIAPRATLASCVVPRSEAIAASHSSGMEDDLARAIASSILTTERKLAEVAAFVERVRQDLVRETMANLTRALEGKPARTPEWKLELITLIEKI